MKNQYYNHGNFVKNKFQNNINSNILIINGPNGCGKTVLANTIAKHL